MAEEITCMRDGWMEKSQTPSGGICATASFPELQSHGLSTPVSLYPPPNPGFNFHSIFPLSIYYFTYL